MKPDRIRIPWSPDPIGFLVWCLCLSSGLLILGWSVSRVLRWFGVM